MNLKGDDVLHHLVANMTTDIENTVDHRRINAKPAIEVTLTTANRKRGEADHLIEIAIQNTKTIENEVDLLIHGTDISHRDVKSTENTVDHHRNIEAHRMIKGDPCHLIKSRLILVRHGLFTRYFIVYNTSCV